MRHRAAIRALLLGLAAAGAVGVAMARDVSPQPGPWWEKGLPAGDWTRQGYVTTSGVPAPYNTFRSPLHREQAVLSRGAAVYAEHCASCHGESGHGDGPASANFAPHPADLAWISAMPMGRWDAFMYWTIAEGGGRFGTVMPAFKTNLAKNDIWSVIAYIQAQLPQRGHAEPGPASGRGR